MLRKQKRAEGKEVLSPFTRLGDIKRLRSFQNSNCAESILSSDRGLPVSSFKSKKFCNSRNYFFDFGVGCVYAQVVIELVSPFSSRVELIIFCAVAVDSFDLFAHFMVCLLYTSPRTRDRTSSRMQSSD